ncbi:MAG: diguanylate cyclase [Pseudomonadota bacterium]
MPLPESPDRGRACEATQTVLVVDDSEGNREVLYELLEPDHAVLLAKSGAEGLELALRHRPDLILLDVFMPGMNGYEVLRRLKAEPRTAGIAVIFVTGLDKPEDEARSLLLGASDYICKPFDPPVVSARVAAHLRLAAYRKQMEQLAHVDGLTGIANRRRFDEALEEESHRARRAQQPLSVAMVDVDFFKQYNDCYGHAKGDEALRAVAQCLRRGMRRPGDLAARYGGEEFALVMADTTPANALVLAQSLCRAVAGLLIPHERSQAAEYLTVSIGVASGQPAGDGDGQALVKRADEALYRAKAAGRNGAVGVG